MSWLLFLHREWWQPHRPAYLSRYAAVFLSFMRFLQPAPWQAEGAHASMRGRLEAAPQMRHAHSSSPSIHCSSQLMPLAGRLPLQAQIWWRPSEAISLQASATSARAALGMPG